MANVIDENKIVLYFDHSDFKKNTQESVRILDSLKEKLTGSATINSVERLGEASQKFNLSSMADSIEIVGKRMKFMGIVGASVINRLTNNVLDSGIKIAKGLPQQIIQGGWNRAQNIEKAKFLIEGLGFTWQKTGEKIKGEINDVYDAVDDAVTGTAYALDEAALVASNFLSSGVTDLNDLNSALRAVSGVASVLSADYGDIGRIYAQVAGQGRMMGDDLLQLSQRGIGAASEIAKYLNANKDVAKQATESAIAQGKQVKAMKEIQTHAKITEADVRSMTSAGAISFDILVGATEKFFEQASKANDTYSGSLSNLKSAFNRLGQTFEEVKLKNLTRIFNALIPVVKRLKIILKPFTKAIGDMSTKATDMAVKAIKSLAKTMGVDFKDAETKGFFRFAKGLSRFKKDIDKTNNEINKGNKKNASSFIVTAKEWQAALDIWYKGTYGTGQKRADEIRKLGMSYENVQGIINRFYKNKFDWKKTEQEYTISDEQKENNKAADEGAKAVKDQNKELSTLGKLTKGIINIVKSFTNVIKTAVYTAKAFKNVFSGPGGKIFDVLASGFLKVTEIIRKFTDVIAKTMKKVANNSDGFKKLIKDGNVLAVGFSSLRKIVISVGSVFSAIGKKITGFFGKFKKAYIQIKQGTEEFDTFTNIVKTLNNVWSTVKNFFSGISASIGIFTAKIKEFKENTNFNGANKFFSSVSNTITGWILKASEKLSTASESFKTFTKTIKNGGDEALKFSGKGEKIAKILDKFKKIGSEIRKAFAEIGHSVSDKVITYIDKIENAFTTIQGTIKNNSGIGIVAGSMIKVGEAIANFLTGLATGEDVAGSFFAKVGIFAHDFMEVVSQAFEWVLDHIGPALEKIVNFFKELSKSEGFTKLKGALKESVEHMIQMSNSGFGRVVGWFKEIAGLTFNNENMTKFVDFFSDISGGIADFVAKINKGESPIRSFFDTWAKTKEVMSFKYQAKKSIGEQFSDLVNAPALASSLNQIKKLDAGGKSLEAANNLTELGTSISEGLTGDNLDAITGKYFKDIKEGNWDKVSKVALRIVSIGAIIKSTKDLGQLAASIGGISKSISGFFRSLSGISDAISKSLRIEAFRTMAIAIALIAASIAVLAVIPKEKMLPAAGVILLFFGIMYKVLQLTTKKEFNPRHMLDVGLAFAGMGAGLMLVAGAVSIIGKLRIDQIAKGVGAVLAFMAGMLAIAHFGKAIFGVGETFLALALGVTILIVAIKAFAKMDIETAARGVAMVAGVMIALSLAARVAGQGAKGCASFFAIAAAMYALVPAILLMALIPFRRAVQGVGAISFVVLALGAAARLATTGEGMKSMAAMASTIGVLTASLVVLSFINTDRLATAVLSIVGTISAISLSAAIMKEAKAAALMMVAVIAALTGAIVLLVELDADGSTKVALSLAAFAVAMGIASAACALVGHVGPAAFIGIGVMAAVVGAMALVIAALGKLGESEGFISKVESFGNLMEALGVAVGKFRAGMANGMADNLGDSAEKVKAFADVMIPLVNSLSNMNTDGIGALKDLASAIVAITGGGLLDKIGSKVGSGGKQNMTGFGDTLDALAENFVPFIRKLNSEDGIGKEAIEKVKSFGDAVRAFADVASALPKTSTIKFGLFKGKFGEVKDLDEFADNVKSAAKTIAKTADNEAVKGFNDAKVTVLSKVGDAITTMSGIAKKLPKVGAWPTLKGKHDLGAFVKDLGELVPNFKTFSEALAGEGKNAFSDLGNVQNVADAVSSMASAAKKIPTNIEGFHPIKGKKEIGEFAKDLGELVPSFKTFSDALAGEGENGFSTFKQETVTAVAGGITAMAEAAKAIPNLKGGAIGASVGGFGSSVGVLTQFAGDMTEFITPFWKFSYQVAKHNKVFSKDNFDTIGMLGGALSSLATVKSKIAAALNKVGGSAASAQESISFESFGAGLDGLADNLKTFITKTKDLEEDDIETAKEKLSSIIGVFDAFKGSGKKKFVLPDTSGFADFAENMKTFGEKMKNVEVDEEQFSAIATYLNTFKSKLENVDAAAVEEKAKVVNKVGNAVSKFNEIGDIPTGKNLVSLASNVSEFCTNIATSSTDNLSDQADKVKSAVKKLASAAKTAAGSKGGGADLSKSGSSAGGSYISGLKKKLDDAKSAGEKLAKAAKDGAGKDSYVENMKTIGSNLGNAVATGLNNAYPAVETAANKIIEKAKKAAEAKAEIKSPSKVFMRIGSFLGEGLVVGINAYQNEVYHASSNMAETSVKAANLAMQGLDDMASPTITPIIDLSNVRKGADAIDAMVSSSKAIGINASIDSSSSRYATPGMVSKLFDKINEMSERSINVKVTDGMSGAQITNNITVDGAEDPEAFANRFVDQLRTQMRMV